MSGNGAGNRIRAGCKIPGSPNQCITGQGSAAVGEDSHTSRNRVRHGHGVLGNQVPNGKIVVGGLAPVGLKPKISRGIGCQKRGTSGQHPSCRLLCSPRPSLGINHGAANPDPDSVPCAFRHAGDRRHGRARESGLGAGRAGRGYRVEKKRAGRTPAAGIVGLKMIQPDHEIGLTVDVAEDKNRILVRGHGIGRNHRVVQIFRVTNRHG